MLIRRVDFDFPIDGDHAERELVAAGLTPIETWEGSVRFSYDSAEAVLNHLLQSGAGTAYYDAVDPSRRDDLERRFVEELDRLNEGAPDFSVVHDFVGSIAGR